MEHNLKMKNWILLLASLCTSAIYMSAAEVTIHISPQGKGDGTGTLSSPLKTLGAAVNKARNLRKNGDDVTVQVHGGTYDLEAPLLMQAEDSGRDSAHPLRIRSASGEQPVISGGRAIHGWKKAEGAPAGLTLWEAEIPEVKQGKWYFRQLFINGERKQRARTPNQGFFRIQGDSPQDKPVRIHFKEGDIRKDWAQSGDVELIAYLAWGDIRMQIRSVDETNHIAVLSGDARPSNREANAQYFIENTPDALDAAGEWYLDKKAGVLRYLGKPEEDLTKNTVIAPRLEDLLMIKGDLENGTPVQHVLFQGLTFSYTDWKLPETGYADTQAAVGVRGNIYVEGARDIRMEHCTFSHLAGYAIDLAKGAQDCVISSSVIKDIGGGGIRIGEGNRNPKPAEENHGHKVLDNEISGLGRVYAPAVGVFIMLSGNNLVAHNEIKDLYYTAVSVGWNWGYQETPCHDNIIEYNHMHQIGQAILSDMGAVYTLGIQKGTVIRNNLIHDVDAFTYGGWGLYPDEGTSDTVWENNLVYHCKSAGFHQHYGRDNIVRNNIFALNREHQLMRTREEQHTSFIFTNNIVYFDSGELLGSNWSNDKFTMDYNLYFDSRNSGAAEKLRFSKATFEEWQKRGHDQHSMIADPLFAAPKKGDFSLQPNSPAFGLGFKRLDLGEVGVRKQKVHSPE